MKRKINHSEALVFDEMSSWIGPSKLQTSKHVSRSQDGEVVVKLSEKLVEEERTMMECPEKSMLQDAAPEPSVDTGRNTPDPQASKYPPSHNKIETIVRRSNRVKRSPCSWWQSNSAVSSSNSAFITADVPSSFKEAVEGPESGSGNPGISLELAAREKDGTWKLVPKSNVNNVFSHSKWLLKIKESEEGSGNNVEKTKAGLEREDSRRGKV